MSTSSVSFPSYFKFLRTLNIVSSLLLTYSNILSFTSSPSFSIFIRASSVNYISG